VIEKTACSLFRTKMNAGAPQVKSDKFDEIYCKSKSNQIKICCFGSIPREIDRVFCSNLIAFEYETVDDYDDDDDGHHDGHDRLCEAGPKIREV
jgi:hypothetical protein